MLPVRAHRACVAIRCPQEVAFHARTLRPLPGLNLVELPSYRVIIQPFESRNSLKYYLEYSLAPSRKTLDPTTMTSHVFC